MPGEGILGNMMNALTQDLIKRSGGLLTVQPEINDWTGKNYQMMNTGSIEIEVGEFLYGLVRVLKPQYILDTGTHFGVSAAYMAQGLFDNDLEGHVFSLEHDIYFHQKSQDLWNNLGLFSFITGIHGKSLDYVPSREYDLILLDTEPDLRFNELVMFYPYLKPGGFVFIHDLHSHMSQVQVEGQEFGAPFGKLPQPIKTWLQDDQLRPFHFPTSRGFTGFYKPKENDYRWY